MKPYCLASSSAGNCYILEFNIKGVPTRIMVECGIPMKDIYNKLSSYNIDISTISACLITHAHSDHSKSARYLPMPIFASKSTLELIGVQGEELLDYQPKRVCKGVYVESFPVEHDCEGSVGFVIKTSQECVIFINDHKRWTKSLKAFKPNYVFIECNYDHKVVYAQLNELKRIRQSKPLSIEELHEVSTKIYQHERNLNAHCSLHGTIRGLQKLNLSECHAIFLMHLSDRYANEYRMKNEIQLKYNILTLAAQKNGGLK